MPTLSANWSVKEGADIAHLHPTLLKAVDLLVFAWAAMFPEDKDGLNITSGHEGPDTGPDRTHGEKSKHYPSNNSSGKGEAIDIRFNDVYQWKASLFVGIAWTILVANYGDIWKFFPEKILTSSSHLHIQLK